MTKLKINLLASKGTPDEIIKSGIKRIEKIIDPGYYEICDQDPQVLFFLTGGSELAALRLITDERFYILIGSRHDNSYAAATEVKAYMNHHKIPSILLDEEDSEIVTELNEIFIINHAIKNIKEKKLGLIGEVSDWLISSSVDSKRIESKTGIHFTQIPWDSLEHFSAFKESVEFLHDFSDHNGYDLKKTSRVYSLLDHVIQSHELDAITVECFPMVIRDKVTACLPLAKFNNDGIPAGCEGDLTAIIGMMLCKELTGIIPWIANINKVTDDLCMFSHCTIAPALVSDFTVKTHFESGEGTAIQGRFKADTVTIFRFDQHFEKVFIAIAQITGHPQIEAACRTQIEVRLSKQDVEILKKNPLGNHHLILPGDYTNRIQLASIMLGMEIVNKQ